MTGVPPPADGDGDLPPSSLGGEQVLLDERKHPDTPHWRWWTTRLGRDEQGTWLANAPGDVARRGTEDPRPFRGGFVTLVPPDDPWIVEFYLDHPHVRTYVNIGTVPAWDGDDHFVQVDLDLDVVVRLDGEVQVIDRDEFEEHRVTLAYPDELAALAEDATQRAVSVLERDRDSFGAAAWLARLESLLADG